MKEKKSHYEEKVQQHNVNYFRDSYSGNKKIEKEINVFSSRAKEDLIKAKPRLLTGRLPAAFKVNETKNDKKNLMPKKILTNNSLENNDCHFTEENSNIDRRSLQNPKKNIATHFLSDNSDSDKTPIVKQKDKEGTFSTRTRTESDETDNDKNTKKAICFKGHLPHLNELNKAQTINAQHRIGSHDFSGDNNPSKQYTTPLNSINSTINISRTYSVFPKYSFEDSQQLSINKQINDILVNKIFALEDGFAYYNNNILKYYFHVPSMEIYLLKEIKYSNNAIEQIKQWKHNYSINDHFLQVYQYCVNNPEGCISIILEHPLGSSLFDIINSTGIADGYFLSKIAKDCLKFLSQFNKATDNLDYGLFCLCDLFYDGQGNMKVFPNTMKSHPVDKRELCDCKIFMYKLAKVCHINISQFFSLGVILLKSAIGNMPLKSFELLFAQRDLSLKCCLLHTLLSIENSTLNAKENLLLTNFFKLIPGNFIQFLCELTSFNVHKTTNINSTWLSIPSLSKRSIINLQLNELFKIVHETLTSDLSMQKFINNFYIVLTNLKENKESKLFLKELKSKTKVIESIAKVYDIEPDYLINKLHMKINDA